jgi:hypothetical protein
MAYLTLKDITRSNRPSELDDASLEITFGEQRLWGPGLIQGGIPISVPTAGVSSESAGPFLIPASLKLKLHSDGEVLPLPISVSPPEEQEIEANSKSGSATLTYLPDNTTFTLEYRVDENLITALYALVVGVVVAVVTFFTTLFNLVINYVKTSGRLLSRAFTGSNRSDKD